MTNRYKPFLVGLFSLLLICTLIPIGSAQPLKVKWGPAYKKQGGLLASISLLDIGQEEYYVLNRSGQRSSLLTYDFNHRLRSSKSLSFKFNKKPITPEKIIETVSGKYAYFPFRDRKKNQWKVLVSKFNNGEIITPKEIFGHQYQKAPRAFTLSYRDQDRINELDVSANGEAVGFINVVNASEKNKLDKLKIAVFDADMKLTWEKTQQFNYKDKRISFKQMILSNGGEVFVLAKIFDVKGGAKNLPKFRYAAFKITENELTEYALNLENDLQATDAGLFLTDQEDRLLLGGFYTSSIAKRDNLEGVFFSQINLATKSVNKKISPFTDEFLRDHLKDKEIAKDKGIGSTFTVDNFISFRDGSFSFIAENYFVQTYTRTDSNGRVYTTVTYHSNDIILPRFNAEGELMNIKTIEKDFRSGIPQNTSYTFAVANNKAYLLFNDTKTKAERKDIATPKGKKSTRYTDLLVIGADGEIEKRETVFTSESLETEFNPGMSGFSNDVFVIGGLKRATYQFGRLFLE